MRSKSQRSVCTGRNLTRLAAFFVDSGAGRSIDARTWDGGQWWVAVPLLINRLCITICLKFYQSNILAITLATKAWAPKSSAHIEKKPPPPAHRENGTPPPKKALYMKKASPLSTRVRKRSHK